MSELEAPAAPLVSDEERTAFLKYISENKTCSLAAAAKAVVAPQLLTVSAERAAVWNLRRRVKHLIAREPDFAEEYRTARGYGQDQIRTAVYDRAVVGWDEVTETYGSDGVLAERKVVHKHDHRLLALMAKAYLPEYGVHTTIELHGTGGGAIEIEDRSAKIDAIWRVLRDAGALPDIVDAEAHEVAELEPSAGYGGGAASGDVPGVADVLAEPEDG